MNQFHWTPKQWACFSNDEKSIIMAGIDLRITQEENERKEQERKIEQSRRRTRRR